MKIINSVKNEIIKETLKIREEDFFWWEGFNFFYEIKKVGCEVERIFIEYEVFEDKLKDKIGPKFKNVFIVSKKVFEKLTFTKSPQGVGGIIKKPMYDLRKLIKSKGNFFYLAGLQDPGNVGAIVRIADAFNFNGVIYEKRGASPYNEKSVRASVGSILRIPTLVGDVNVLSDFKKEGYDIFFLNPSSKKSKKIQEIKISDKNVFVLGQEGQGIDLDFQDKSDIFIPMKEGVDSLNVAVTAGVVAFYVNSGKFV